MRISIEITSQEIEDLKVDGLDSIIGTLGYYINYPTNEPKLFHCVKCNISYDTLFDSEKCCIDKE